MESSLSWIDHDPKARERTLRIFSFFQERESRDEMGIGSVRDSFADRLFPGTSTIQTRLRYMLFVPWIYRKLENKRVPKDSFATQADKLERDLIQPLLDSDDQAGVFGRTSGNKIKRLPSSVYWAGLRKWGILCTPYYSQDEYHRRIGEIYKERDALSSRKKEMAALDDDLDVDYDAISWHPRLPPPPNDFPEKADLSLTRAEAEFIQDRIQRVCGGSLLAFLSRNCKPADAETPWDHPDHDSFPDDHKKLLHHARLFSETMHSAALNYNVQLAKLRPNDELVSKHEEKFKDWLDRFPLDEINRWETDRLWELTSGRDYKITRRTRDFVESWIELVQRSPRELLENKRARELVRAREISLKGPRSRFKNRRALDQWSGDSGTSRLVYRWHNVKVLLKDFHQGMTKR